MKKKKSPVKKGKKKKPGWKVKSTKPTPDAFKAPAAGPDGKIPKITKSMSFEYFCQYHSYPDYDGLYRWQYEWFKRVWPKPKSMTLVARNHGKTIGHGNISQFLMSAKGWDVLYLGWTARRRDVAKFVYTFFDRRLEIKQTKSTSEFHFETTYGTTFDTYSVKSKEILGKHDLGTQDREIVDGINDYLKNFKRNSDNKLLMVIDDPIDNTFRKEQHKEKDLEDFYDSTIMPIKPNKIMIVGTKKFEKDFFYFIEQKYGSKIEVVKHTPFLEKTDARYGKEKDNPCNLLCPERWIWNTDPDYKKYLKLQLLIESGVDVETLSKKKQKLARRLDLYEEQQDMNPYWWFAEYMQDPHPITGEVWKDVVYRNVIKTQSAYNLLVISIDRATTQKKTSDETGIVVMLREYNPKADPSKEKPEPNQYLVINDLTQKITIDALIPLIHQLYNDYMAHYGRTLMIRVIVEKQGGGSDFCQLAYAAGFRWASDAIMIQVHSSRNKEDRILDLLQLPITNGTVEFLSTLKESKLVNQILSFPYSINDDAIDALGTGKLEGDKIGQKHSPRALREALEVGGKQDQLKQWNNIFGQSKSSSHGEGIF